MKLQAYRGTNLNEAVRIMNAKMPNKYLYWITDKQEANIYAGGHKYDHENEAAAVIEAEIDIPNSMLRMINSDEFEILHENKSKWVKDKIAVYELSEFSLILVSPGQSERVRNARIIEVI